MSQFNKNDFVKYILSTLAYKENFSIPCAFQNELKRIDFDFSLQSLHAIDGLLYHIRNTIKPTYSQFVASQDTQIFLTALASYCIATVANVGGFMAKWLDHEEFKLLVSDDSIELCFETKFVCFMNGAVRLPIYAVLDLLFKDPIGYGLESYANGILNEPTECFSLRDDVKPSHLPECFSEQQNALSTLADCVGILAGSVIAHAPSSNFGGTLLAPSEENGQSTLKIIKFISEDPFSEVREHLSKNPREKDWLAGAYDGFVYPFYGKTDAIIVEAHDYQRPNIMPIKIVLPYRNDDETQIFSFKKPILWGTGWSQLDVKIISNAFFKQIHAMKPALESWQKYHKGS